nr:hypothetical protein Iba_chr04dCG12090 [Ipomoea batatas]
MVVSSLSSSSLMPRTQNRRQSANWRGFRTRFQRSLRSGVGDSNQIATCPGWQQAWGLPKCPFLHQKDSSVKIPGIINGLGQGAGLTAFHINPNCLSTSLLHFPTYLASFPYTAGQQTTVETSGQQPSFPASPSFSDELRAESNSSTARRDSVLTATTRSRRRHLDPVSSPDFSSSFLRRAVVAVFSLSSFSVSGDIRQSKTAAWISGSSFTVRRKQTTTKPRAAKAAVVLRFSSIGEWRLLKVFYSSSPATAVVAERQSGALFLLPAVQGSGELGGNPLSVRPAEVTTPFIPCSSSTKRGV